MPNEGGGVEHCSICHLTMGRCEPRVTAVSSNNGSEGKKEKRFSMSINGLKQAMGTSELVASVVPGLEPRGKGNYYLNLNVFFNTSGDHVRKLAACLPAHLVREFLPMPPVQQETTGGNLRVVQV